MTLTLQRKLVLVVSGLGAVLVAFALLLVNQQLTERSMRTAIEDAEIGRRALDDSLAASAESWRIQARIVANETLAKEALLKRSPDLLFTYADSAHDRTSAQYLLVVDTRGKVLVDARKKLAPGDDAFSGAAPHEYAGFMKLGGETVVAALVPIRLDDRTLGFLVLADPVRREMLASATLASRASVTIADLKSGRLASTLPDSVADEAAHAVTCQGPPEPHEMMLAGEPAMVTASPVRGLDGAPVGCAVIARPLAAQVAEVRELQRWLALLGLGVTALGLLLGGVAGARVTRPLRQLTDAAKRVARGDLSQETLPVRGNDEVGALAQAFNEMLLALRSIAATADRVATGDLTVPPTDGGGQVGDAFNRMIRGQREIVRELTDAALQLAGAAAEIYAATQQQEGATTHQKAGVEEVSRTTQSLLESASHIAESARGVLASAERANDTTDRMAARLGELGTHLGRISELLDVIREVAERSDLLALNASIESSRAGDAGRTFGLVAAEMRRLAERVKGSVEDVRTMLADIKASSHATVLATEEGRKLSEGTTDAARQITRVTQQQRTATEQVLQSMKHIGAVLTESAAATQQTRASASVLKTEADRLRGLVSRFVIEKGAAPEDAP
jgi:methyl-accepting chemotaxis protein